MRHVAIVLALAGCGAAAVKEPAIPPGFGQRISEYDVIPFAGGTVHVRLASDGHTVVETIANRYAIPVAIRAERQTTNLTAVVAGKAEVVVPAHAELRAAVWTITDHHAGWHEHTELRTQYGDPAARTTPYVYALPFAAGETHELIQGFHGEFSHHGDDEYAVDFAMPVGSTVRAARAGVVVAFNDRATGSGLTPEFRERDHANWIVVLHRDGTLGEYWHLQPGGVLVQIGQQVERGDVLGRSGATGFTSTPHLHFEIRTAVSGNHVRSFEFVFARRRGDRTGTTPAAGERYTAFE